jgi:hypothetical protein
MLFIMPNARRNTGSDSIGLPETPPNKTLALPSEQSAASIPPSSPTKRLRGNENFNERLEKTL